VNTVINLIKEFIQKYWSFKKKKEKKKRSLYFRIIRGVLLLFVCFLLFLVLIDINFLWLFGKSPKIKDLSNPKSNIASELYSADGKLMGKYFTENRSPVKYNEISKKLIKTLIATEDIRFYQHHGIDYQATLSIIWSMFHGEKRGGSTISQQLVKNLFKTRTNYSRGLFGHIPGLKAVITKMKEWIGALKVEYFYSKEEILTMYLNTVDFGSNAYGIKTASRTFFNTKPSKLTIEQSALLIGLLKAPSYYSPIMNPKNALARRNTVLQQLEKYDIITSVEYDSISRIPIKLKYNVENNYDGNATYFREAVSKSLKEWCKTTNHNLYSDGLKIYTTIDSRLQQFAEEAMQEHMQWLQRRFYEHWRDQVPWSDGKGNEFPRYIEKAAKQTKAYENLMNKYKNNLDSVNYYMNRPHKMTVFTWKGEKDTTFSSIDSIKYYKYFLQTGFLSMNPHNGYIKAWVGGIDFKYFKYDHVNQFKRQPGSLFKAYVYAAAMDHGYGPCDSISDQPVTINYIEKGVKKSWSPHNADCVFSGKRMTLKHAFAKSVNSAAVQIAEKVGWQNIIRYAHKMGVKSEIENYPSVCLGSSDLSLFELVNSYCCMINDGYLVDPILVTRIEDHNGNVIYEDKPNKKQVLSQETAFLMCEMLKAGLTEPGGTTQALFEHDLFRFKTDFGGKTGTSSNQSDGWFIGVTPDLISGCWVGNDDRLLHFRTTETGEGCKTALPIFGKYMAKVMADPRLIDYRKKFKKPDIKITKSYTCHTRYVKPDTLEFAPDSTIFEDL